MAVNNNPLMLQFTKIILLAIVRRCDLRGQSCGLRFMVLYEAKEQDNHEAITRLRIKVPNALDAELKPLITEYVDSLTFLKNRL